MAKHDFHPRERQRLREYVHRSRYLHDEAASRALLEDLSPSLQVTVDTGR